MAEDKEMENKKVEMWPQIRLASRNPEGGREAVYLVLSLVQIVKKALKARPRWT